MKFKHCLVFLATLSAMYYVRSEDVTRFRGVNSQGKYNEPGLLKKWPKGGLTPKWINSDLGYGWSSVIKIKDRLFLNCLDSTNKKKESIVCLDLNGKKVWQTTTGNIWSRSFSYPRSTPTYVEDNGSGKLVVLTGSGEVCCLDSTTGKLLWTKEIAKTYKGRTGTWGYSESLVTKNGKVFATPCGAKASIVALNLKDGSVAWEAPSNGDKCAYVSPVIYQNQLIQVTGTYVFAVDIESGKLLWKDNYARAVGSGKDINCITPLLKDNQLFVTGGYNHGGVMYEILPNGKGVKILWTNEDLDPHHGGVVELNGAIYGSNWLNNKAGNWMSVDWKTGKTNYNEAWKKMGKGAIITADGMLYLYEERRGTLGLVKPGNKFEVVSQFPVKFGSKQHWAHPVISDGILYVRHGNGLGAFDLRKK